MKSLSKYGNSATTKRSEKNSWLSPTSLAPALAPKVQSYATCRRHCQPGKHLCLEQRTMRHRKSGCEACDTDCPKPVANQLSFPSGSNRILTQQYNALEMGQFAG
jgi:MinD superfamily P-loop ATPase